MDIRTKDKTPLKVWLVDERGKGERERRKREGRWLQPHLMEAVSGDFRHCCPLRVSFFLATATLRLILLWVSS
jgi:hypothetical protein